MYWRFWRFVLRMDHDHLVFFSNTSHKRQYEQLRAFLSNL